eukprot:27745-Prymnesium_polylepis.1
MVTDRVHCPETPVSNLSKVSLSARPQTTPALHLSLLCPSREVTRRDLIASHSAQSASPDYRHSKATGLNGRRAASLGGRDLRKSV